MLRVDWYDDAAESGYAIFGEDVWMLVSIPIGLMCSCIGALIVHGLRGLNMLRCRHLQTLSFPALFLCQAVLVALTGWVVFEVTGLRGIWGIGVGSLQHALTDGSGLKAWEHLVFAAGKAVALVLAVSARAPGDVLEPVLLVGGFAGGAAGRALSHLMDVPNEAVMTPCIVFGMVGLFASCFRFPLTPIVIVLEITGIESYSIILPTALAGFTAMTASSRMFLPILDEIMHEDGIDLRAFVTEVAAAELLNLHQPGGHPPLYTSSEDGSQVEAQERRLSVLFPSMEEMFQGYVDVHPPTHSRFVSDLERMVSNERLAAAEEEGNSSQPLPRRESGASSGGSRRTSRLVLDLTRPQRNVSRSSLHGIGERVARL